MFYFTNDQIDEIEKRLAVRAKKDTDFDPISEADEDDLVAIIHNGRNMICKLSKLPGRLKAKRYSEIPAEITEENILEAPTAFSVSVLKTLLGIEELPAFNDDIPYEKNSFVKHVDDNGILRGYIFTDDKTSGYWDDSKVTEINYNSILESISDILSEFKEGGRVYVLENYFTNGKAKRAIADEDGKNFKEYYALKSDIREAWQRIEDQIAGKVDKSTLRSKGHKKRPVYFDENAEPQVIDGLDVPEDIHSSKYIEADQGIAAGGIANLSMGGGGGGGGTIAEIQIDGTVIPERNGIVNLPAYPKTLAELEDDSTHRTVTDIEKSNWNAKYDKPSGGIPKTDLDENTQESLDKANSAVQPEDLNPITNAIGNLESQVQDNTEQINSNTERISNTEREISVLDSHIGMDSLAGFIPDHDYVRGETVKIVDGTGVVRGYRCVEGYHSGQTINMTKFERLTYKTLAEPLYILESDLLSMLTVN